MAKIVKVIGREIIDSRGNPTVEAEVHLEGGFVGMAASAPNFNIARLSSPDPDSEAHSGHISENPGGQPDQVGSYIPAINADTAGAPITIAADQLALVNKLWSFVSKSSAVGQSVKDWLRVHFGVNPNDDMFNSTHLIESVVNDVSINTVVSTARLS